VINSAARLDAQLDKLEMAQLVRRADDAELAYLFKHTLTQETTYRSLLQKRRREVHRRVAEAYETQYAGRLPEIASVLVQHYAESGDDGKTLLYSVLAGDEAARVYANAEAVSYYTQALEVAKRGGGQQSAPLTELYLKRGRAMEVSNQYAGAIANYQEMEAEGKARSDRPLILAALIAQATPYSIASAFFDPAKGQELSDQALALARELADRTAEAKILWNFLLLNYFTDRPRESVQFGEQSLAIARALDLKEQTAFTLSDIGRSYAALGQMERALAAQTEARALWRELGNLPLLADNLTNSAGLHLNRGELDIAVQFAKEALSTAHSIGNVWGEVYAEQVLSAIYVIKGNLGDSLPLLRDSITRGEQIGALFPVPVGYSFLSWIYAKLGEPNRALEFARSGVERGERMFRPFLPMGYAMLGYANYLNGNMDDADLFITKSYENLDLRNFDLPQPFFVAIVDSEIALAKGELERSLKVLDQLIDNLRELNVRIFLAEALYSKSRVLRAMDRTGEARAFLIEARSAAQDMGELFTLLPILTSLSRLEIEFGNAKEAESLRLQAKDIARELGQGLSPDLLELFSSLPEVRFAEGSFVL
jgi:tetratricopeptide (TPR) repeat protein